MGSIYFNIAALCIYILNFYLYFSQNRLYLRQTKIFFLFLFTGICSTATNLITQLLYINKEAYSIGIHYASTIVFYLFQNTVPLLFCLFLLEFIKKEKLKTQTKIMFYAPLAIVALLTLTTPFTHAIFYFDENLTYTRGSLLPVLYCVVSFYFIVFFYAFFKSRKEKRTGTEHVVIAFLSASIVALVVKFFFPDFLVQNVGLAISSLIVLLTIQDFNRFTDYGTQLYNRNGFLIQYDSLMKRKKNCVLFLINVDTATFIYTIFGPDMYLLLEKQMIAKIFGQSHTDRFGAKIDQGKFILAVSDLDTIEEEEKKLLEAFTNPWYFEDRALTISAHMCKITIPEDTNDIRNVFQAQKELTQRQGQYTINTLVPFNELKLTKSARYMEIHKKITDALLTDGFTVVFQPIIARKTKKAVAGEALVRFKDTTDGFISPAEFIPVAEQTGKIHEIGNIVIHKSCQFMQSLRKANINIRFIEINLSPIQCLHPNLSQQILSIVKKYDLKPQDICFEITETAANRTPAIIKTNLENLAALGFLIAIDDFGTGYSNITQLMNLPFRIVKFDRSLLEAANRSENGELGIQGLVSMFKHIDTKLVAEGAETAQQVEQIHTMGIDYIQGYYFSKPLNPEIFKEYVTSNEGA